MLIQRTVGNWLIIPVTLLATLTTGWAQANRPLTEENLTTLIQLRIDDDDIMTKLKREGITFVVDDATIDRLKKAGASDKLVAAIKSASSLNSNPASGAYRRSSRSSHGLPQQQTRFMWVQPVPLRSNSRLSNSPRWVPST